MQLPLTDPDTLFEELLQDLPAETVQMARAFKAFVRAKKVKTPAQLLRVVFLYCGLDKSLREVAGTFTALYESITDQSVAERLRACGPWVQAMLRQMLPMAAVETLPAGRRFVVIDASSMQAPGATGTDHRLHIAMDLVSLQFLEVLVSDVHTGETLKHFTFAPGDVAVADRGYAQCQGMQCGGRSRGPISSYGSIPSVWSWVTRRERLLELCAALKRQHMETLRTLAVTLRATGGQHEVRGWVHAYRLNAEQANRARHKCRQGHKKGTPTAESLFLAGWVLVFTTLAPAVLSAQTIMALYRCRWQVEIAIKRWKSVLDVDALRAKATQPPGGGVAPWEIALCVDAGAAHAASARGQLGAAGSRACRHVVARLGHAQRRDSTDDYRCLILEGGRLGGMPEGVGGTASPEDITTAASRGARCPLSLRCEQTRGYAHCSLTACYPEEPMLILAQMGGTPHPHSRRDSAGPA